MPRLEVRCPHTRQEATGATIYFFADHIRALTESFDSRLADVENPLVRQLGRYLLWPRVGLVVRSVNREGRVTVDDSRPPLVSGQIDQTNRDRQ